MTLLSLCMIVRDEFEHLGACLTSVAGVCDEVCVVDTGSRDGTPELAERLGARVARVPWADDFAAARNASLVLARGDWALVLDADEALDLALHDAARSRALLLDFAAGGNERAGRVCVDNRGDGHERSLVALTRFVPLGRGLRFAGRIHEQVVRGDGAALARADTGVHVVHGGYAPLELARKDKLVRNRTLLERELAERPDDAYVHYHLGRTLALAGEPMRALEAFERALALSKQGDLWPIHALELGAECLRATGRSAQALELLRAALPDVPARADTRFLAGLLELDLGDVAAAEGSFRVCRTLAPDPSGAESAPAASGWAAAYNLGVICELSGRAQESRSFYEQALAACPGHRPTLDGLRRLGP